MQVSKPQALLVQTAPTQIGQKAFLGLSLGVGFRLSDPRILCHEAAVWAALSESPAAVSLNETAMPKRHAEWLLLGHAVQPPCSAPAGATLRAAATAEWTCSVDLAGVKKQIQCKLAQPHPARLLLDHSNAWQGPEQENPCGREHAPAPLNLVTPQGSKPSPWAATGPLDMRWRARFRPAMYGSPAEAAQDGSHMGWPAHTDLRYFQQAASDQWLQAAHWPLGAAYTLRGMGPQGAGYAQALPQLCAHAAWQASADEPFQSIAFVQQSVWFLPDADIGVMWWNGQIGLNYLLEDRVEHLVVAVRGASETLSLEALAAVAHKRAAIKDRDMACESDLPLLPQVADGWTWEQIESADEHPNESPPRKDYAAIRSRVLAQEEFIQQVAREHQTQQARLTELPKPQPAAAVVLSGAPDVWQAKLAANAERVLRNVSIEGQNLRGLQWSGWRLENVVFKHCAMEHSRIEDCNWKNVRIEQCALTQSVLARLQWTQGGLESSHAMQTVWDSVQLDELALTASDLSGARIDKGVWKQVRMTDLYGAQGQAHAVQWENCNLQDCHLPDWQWRQVLCSMLPLVGCQLPGLQAQHCRLDRISAIDTDLSGSRWNVCLFKVSVFDKKTRLTHSQFTDCQFTQTCLSGAQAAQLQALHCSFTEFTAQHLHAPQSRWTACVLHNAQLSQAQLREAVFESCSLKEARLFGADLQQSQIRHSNLIGAQTCWALAPGPGLWHSNLTAGHVDLPRRSAC